MNKTLIYWVVGAIVVLGGGYLVMTQLSTQSTSGRAMTGSMKELIAKGNAKCAVTNNVENSQSSGIVYVSGGKLRGDFSVQVTSPSAMTIQAHMISDGATIYSWSDQSAQGVKIPVAKAEVETSAGGNANLYNATVQYDCSSWSPDESVFAPPSAVTFMDVSAMMQGGMPSGPAQGGAGAGMQAPNCSMCDAAPEAQRAQCRAALGCK